MVKILQIICYTLLILNGIILIITQILDHIKFKKWEKQINEDLEKLSENTRKLNENTIKLNEDIEKEIKNN